MQCNFYKPVQGDTAATVADGYDNNFQTLDTSKADAAATTASLAAKVDKVEGEELMTAAEREKLTGIEAGANAYTHPETHPADMIADTAEKVVMTASEREKLTGVEAGANAYTLPAATAATLGGVKAGNNVTIAEDGTLSATAAPYELPKASSTVLGGIKVGNNLTMRADGTLDAAAGGGGGSGGGGGILVLPYVAPEHAADGTLSNSAAFVEAWGPILSQYFASLASFALYVEMDVSGGEGVTAQIPCNMLNLGGDADAIQWLLSGFSVVNMPFTGPEPVSCQATCTAVLVCTAAGEMQSIASYIQSGIIGPDGGPNLLGGGDAVIVELPFSGNNNSWVSIDEAVLKAAIQPLLPKLMLPIPPRAIVNLGGAYVNGMFQILGEQLVITAYGIHPYTIGHEGNTVIVRAGVIATIVNGTITTAQGFTACQGLVTTEAMNAALEGKAALVPQSLEEQLVPGEVFADRDGTLRQVYCRSFVGTTPSTEPDYSALSLSGTGYASVIADVKGTVESGGNWSCFEPTRILAGLNGELTMIVDQSFLNRQYRITIKYTKS